MDDLLIKYIMEEATPEESKQVRQWIADDAANRVRFENLQTVWQLAAQPNLQPAADTPQALQRLKQTLKAKESVPIKRIWPRVWTAAAVVVGVITIALGAYVLMKPKNTVKENPPVVQPDTVQQKPIPADTAPTVQPVPALHTDTLPIVKPRKKTRPARVAPVERVPPKKKVEKRPTQLTDTTTVKRKHPTPPKPVNPVRKHKSVTSPAAPQAPVKEPPFS
jgi:hypothetical protein